MARCYLRSMLRGTLKFRKDKERNEAAKKIGEEVQQVIYEMKQTILLMKSMEPPINR